MLPLNINAQCLRIPKFSAYSFAALNLEKSWREKNALKSLFAQDSNIYWYLQKITINERQEPKNDFFLIPFF